MVPDYDDDEIVEDYEEVSTDSAPRRVASGGPVQRPANGGRPETSAAPQLPDDQLPPKGKITKSSAKLIWFICITVSVLAIAAVVIDQPSVWDPLKRHKPAGGNTVANAPTNTRSRNSREENLSPQQKLQREFLNDVIGVKMKAMDASKAWDYYWLSYLEFDDAYGKAATLKKKEGVPTEELEEAWAIAIKHYYKARYAAELFRYRFDEDYISKSYMPISIDRNSDDVTFLDEATLKDEKARMYQAAYSKIESKSVSINLFKTDILKNELTAQAVHGSQDWADKHFGEFKGKWEAASGERKFSQEDLDFVNGPDYKPGEKKLFEAYLESRGS